MPSGERLGASHYIANAAKRQFFRPGTFDNDRGSTLLRGLSGHALALLIAGRIKLPEQMGSWAGDPLYIVTDGTEPVWSAALLPDGPTGGLADYDVLQVAYTDVTYPVVAGLGQRDDLAEELLRRGETSNTFFLGLATVLMHYEVPALHARFLRAFGRDWRQRFNEVLRLNGGWQPLPAPWGRRDGL
jgi:hypothetical protein